MNLLAARLLFWKKQAPSILFWLLFPMAAAVLFVHVGQAAKSDAKIPIAITAEDDTEQSERLISSLKQDSLLRVSILPADKALNLLEQHEFDSVFIIKEGFGGKLKNGNRRGTIEGYQSDRSFAYTPVKELVLSHVQKMAGRLKAVETIHLLSKHIGGMEWTDQEIIGLADQIEAEEHLLDSRFFYAGKERSYTSSEHMSPWGVWAVASLLSTCFLFDWVIKERRAQASSRILFSRYGMIRYQVGTALFYAMMLLAADAAALWLFSSLYSEPADWSRIGSLLLYRVTICLAAFWLALTVKNMYVFYTISLAAALFFLMFGGAVFGDPLHIGGISIHLLNPVHAFVNGSPNFLLPLLFASLAGIQLIRKEQSNA